MCIRSLNIDDEQLPSFFLKPSQVARSTQFDIQNSSRSHLWRVLHVHWGRVLAVLPHEARAVARVLPRGRAHHGVPPRFLASQDRLAVQGDTVKAVQSQSQYVTLWVAARWSKVRFLLFMSNSHHAGAWQRGSLHLPDSGSKADGTSVAREDRQLGATLLGTSSGPHPATGSAKHRTLPADSQKPTSHVRV